LKLIANARMYAVNAAVEARWREIFGWIAQRSEVPLEVIEHAPPAPLEALWRRADLGAAAMCGYPLATWARGHDPPPVPIVAPAPLPAPFAGRPVYWTDIVVRADSRFERDDDLAGARFGWTVEDSQSGYQAPRRHFAARALARGGRFFGSVHGPLVTPRGVVDSILEGSIDAGPLDAYWHALLRRHEPATAERLRVIARTEETPIPCFVAASAAGGALRERLGQAFVDAGEAEALGNARSDLALAGFERVDAGAYRILASQAQEVDALGYARLG
jgi:ABC-type phosphate/phosphonate transport system substrate-binding protein